MNAEMHRQGVQQKVVWGSRAGLALVLACAAAATSCGQVVRTGNGNSSLVLTSLKAAPGSGTTFGDSLQSDVISSSGGAFPDSGQAVFQLVMKDLAGPAPTAVNSITITQYHVEYIRSDGRNTPGVDVPFAFDGGLGVTVTGTGSAGFTLVRIQAKLESPLAALVHRGGAEAITTIARVTFYGHDQTGREVSVSGNIEVTFADWAG